MANLKHGVVVTDKMFGTDNRTGVYSFKYMESDAGVDIDNGHVVKLDGLFEGEREIYKGVKPEANTPIANVVLVASPELDPRTKVNNLADFTNKADVAARGYSFNQGQIFSLTDECLDGTPAVGSIVELQADTKMKVVDSATSGSTTIGTIEAIETRKGIKFNVIRVA